MMVATAARRRPPAPPAAVAAHADRAFLSDAHLIASRTSLLTHTDASRSSQELAGSDEELGSDDGSDDGSGDEGAGAGAGDANGAAPAKRKPIYDVEGLHDKLEDIAWADDAPWEEAQAITGDAPTQVDDVEDDLGRELAFYNQALAAAASAIARFEASGAPWRRPADYYAEMVKSDEHMAKVKDRLMYEQQQIEEAEERRKAREQKAYAKQVQAQKERERAADKKRQIEAVQQLRKQRQKSVRPFAACRGVRGCGGGWALVL